MALGRVLSLFWRWLLQLSIDRGVKTEMNRIKKYHRPELTRFDDVFEMGVEGERERSRPTIEDCRNSSMLDKEEEPAKKIYKQPRRREGDQGILES